MRVARSVTARWRDARAVRRHRRLAEGLSAAAEGIADESRLFDLVSAIPELRPAQIRSEFTELMRRVRGLRPATALEIGTATGGTTFLLSRVLPPGARLLTIDIADNPARREAVRAFSTGRVQAIAVCADSHDAATADLARRLLGTPNVPFVFIDGDHSYEGVMSDFRIHSSLVSVGGCIAFHDIVPDSLSRHGRDTGTRTGGVPRFWSEVRTAAPSAIDIVEDPQQDGYGIGFLPWTQEVERETRALRNKGVG